MVMVAVGVSYLFNPLKHRETFFPYRDMAKKRVLAQPTILEISHPQHNLDASAPSALHVSTLKDFAMDSATISTDDGNLSHHQDAEESADPQPASSSIAGMKESTAQSPLLAEKKGLPGRCVILRENFEPSPQTSFVFAPANMLSGQSLSEKRPPLAFQSGRVKSALGRIRGHTSSFDGSDIPGYESRTSRVPQLTAGSTNNMTQRAGNTPIDPNWFTQHVQERASSCDDSPDREGHVDARRIVTENESIIEDGSQTIEGTTDDAQYDTDTNRPATRERGGKGSLARPRTPHRAGPSSMTSPYTRSPSKCIGDRQYGVLKAQNSAHRVRKPSREPNHLLTPPTTKNRRIADGKVSFDDVLLVLLSLNRERKENDTVLMEEHERTARENTDLAQTLAAKEREVEEINGTLAASKQECETLNEDIDKLRAKYKQLRVWANTTETKYVSIKAKHNGLSQTMSKLQEDAASDRAELQELIKASHDQCQDIEKRHAVLQQDTKQLVRAVERSERELEAKHRAHLREKELNASYVREIFRSRNQQNKKIKALRAQVSSLESEKLNSWLDEYSRTQETDQASLTECLRVLEELRQGSGARSADTDVMTGVLEQIKCIPEDVSKALAKMQTAHSGGQKTVCEQLDKLSSAPKDVQTLTRDIGSLREAVNGFKVTVESRMSTLDSYAEERRAVMQIVQELLGSHKSGDNVNTKNGPADTRSVISMLADLRGMCTGLDSEKRDYSQRCEQLTRELTHLQTESQASQDRLGSGLEVAVNSPNPITALLGQLRSLARSTYHPMLDELSQKQDTACRKAEKDRTTLEELEAKYQVLLEESRTLKYNEAQAQRRTRDVENRFEKKRDELIVTDQRVHQLESQITALHSKLALSVGLKSQVEQHEQVVAELQAKSDECHSLREELDRTNDRTRGLEQSLTSTLTAQESLEAETNQLRKIITDQKTDISKMTLLQERLDCSLRAMEGLKSEVSALQIKADEGDSLRRKNEQLEAAVKSKEAQITEARQKILAHAQQEVEFKNLEMVLRERDSTLSALRIEVQTSKIDQKGLVDLEKNSDLKDKESSRTYNGVCPLEQKPGRSEAVDDTLTEEEAQCFDQEVVLSLTSQLSQSRSVAQQHINERGHAQISAGDESEHDRSSEDESRPLRRAAQRPGIREEEHVGSSWRETGVVEETQYDTQGLVVDISSDLSPPASEEQLQQMIESMYDNLADAGASSQCSQTMLAPHAYASRPGTSGHDMLLHSESDRDVQSSQRQYVPPAGQPVTQVPVSSHGKNSPICKERRDSVLVDIQGTSSHKENPEDDLVMVSSREMPPPNSSAKRQRFAEQGGQSPKRAKTNLKNLEIKPSAHSPKFLRTPRLITDTPRSAHDMPFGAKRGGGVLDAAATVPVKSSRKPKTVRKGSKEDKYGKRFGEAA